MQIHSALGHYKQTGKRFFFFLSCLCFFFFLMSPQQKIASLHFAIKGNIACFFFFWREHHPKIRVVKRPVLQVSLGEVEFGSSLQMHGLRKSESYPTCQRHPGSSVVSLQWQCYLNVQEVGFFFPGLFSKIICNYILQLFIYILRQCISHANIIMYVMFPCHL